VKIVRIDSRVVPGRTHGLRSTYVDGCRCDECRKAERDYRRALRKRKSEDSKDE
jgi:hypothetical protein